MKNKYFNDQDNYYPSMVDMMAGILFIMIILLMGFVIEENVQKSDSSQAQVERKIDDLKNTLLNQLSTHLTKNDIVNTVCPEEGAVLIHVSDCFLENRVEITKGANKIYSALSQGLAQVLLRSDEGKQSLSSGYLDKIYVEVHSSQSSSSPDDLLSWGRTIGFYGALLTAEQNPVENQLVRLKNINGHQILSIKKFANGWLSLTSLLKDGILLSKIKKKNLRSNAYILLRFSMVYPSEE